MHLGKIAAGFAAIVIVAGAEFMWRSAPPRPYPPPPDSWTLRGLDPPAPPAAGPRPGRPTMGGPGWRVIDTRSVLGVLIVTVETDRLHEAPGITHQVVDRIKDDHVEALVYFHRPHERLASTRVQWTPAGGYVRTDLPSQ